MDIAEIERDYEANMALLLLTNRVLFDFLSIQVDSGAFKRESVEALIRFSEAEVVKGSPALKGYVDEFGSLLRSRLAPDAGSQG